MTVFFFYKNMVFFGDTGSSGDGSRQLPLRNHMFYINMEAGMTKVGGAHCHPKLALIIPRTGCGLNEIELCCQTSLFLNLFLCPLKMSTLVRFV